MENDSSTTMSVAPADQNRVRLSANQERFWFLQQIQPESFGHNVYIALKLTGSVHTGTLEQTIGLVVQRYAILQATFPFVKGQPQIKFDQESKLEIQIQALDHLPAPLRELEARRLMSQLVKIPFNLATGPLIRVTLIHLSSHEHLLLVVLHQIICDSDAIRILAQEIIDTYQKVLTGVAIMPPEPISHQDCLLETESKRDKGLISYWINQLRNLPALELPVMDTRPPVQTYNGATRSIWLRGTMAEGLRQMSRQEEVDLSLIILATLQILIFRYTQQPDLALGYSVSGRSGQNQAKQIGCFENFLVLRTKLSDNSAFREVLKNLNKTYRDALAHQDLAFAELVQSIGVNRDVTRTPLFQILFRSKSGLPIHGQAADLLLEEFEFDGGLAPFDLTLEVIDQGEAIHCAVNYNTDLFTDATITRLLGHFQTLLHGIAADPEKPISLLPLLTGDESHQMLVEWNATSTPYAKDRCLHELFEDQVSRFPHNTAVRFGGQKLTYQQLDAAANQMAGYLRKSGVGPQIAVGICIEPSVEMIVGMLGILKAGGIYVPLDPEYPRERIAFMLEDTGAQVLLTQRHLWGSGLGPRIRLILVDEDKARIFSEKAESVSAAVKSHFPACIFYTSGSTGNPKGVPVPHYGINRLVRETNYLHFLPSDRVAQASNVSFDGATFEIWGALLNGGCLVGVPKEILLSPADLADFIRQENINVLFMTPAVFHQTAQVNPQAFETLRDLLMGGEILEPRWVREVMQKGPPTRLLNAYGPTESTTFATWYLVPGIPPEDRSIPIGRPIANTTIYILDRNLQPTPVGITGELYIGGDGLALGYLNRPDQTAEKFIVDPFHADSRLYKTGDLARYLPDGNVEFLGRIDHQIKIRGFRIEPGEIEEALKKYPGVREALVLAREAEPGDKRLAAYIVADHTTAITGEALRNFLLDKLPPYMIPVFFVFLEKFPLNPNGKIDRQALPIPDFSELISSRGYVGPRHEVEKQLIEVWEKVLGLRPIGVFDDFFDLGGNSLLAARIFIHLEKIFGKRIPIYLLYQRPTVAELATVFRERDLLKNLACGVLEPIFPSGQEIPLFLIDMRKMMPFLKRYLGPEQPMYHLESPMLFLRSDLVGAGIQGYAAYYLSKIRQIQTRGPYLLGGFSAGALVALEIASQLKDQGEEAALLLLLDPTVPGKTSSPKLNPSKFDSNYFNSLSLKEKVSYILKNIHRKSIKVAASFFRRSGIPIPKFLAGPLSFQLGLFMVRDYQPQVVESCSLLIRCNQPGTCIDYSWSEILKGPLEVLTFDIGHTDLSLEPYIEKWGAIFKKNLEEAKAKIRAAGVSADANLEMPGEQGSWNRQAKRFPGLT